MPSKNQISNGLTYVAQKPAFLQNFGKPPSPPQAPGRRGREDLPERPKEGQWAGGSDGEGEDSDDEWGERFGGGGDDGPQVVVLKEGRHLSGEEVKRERRRAKGLPSISPPPVTAKNATSDSANPSTTSTKPIIPRPFGASGKRKLVGMTQQDDEANDEKNKSEKDDSNKAAGNSSKAKKKKKSTGGMLSFDDAEGEE